MNVRYGSTLVMYEREDGSATEKLTTIYKLMIAEFFNSVLYSDHQ